MEEANTTEKDKQADDRKNGKPLVVSDLSAITNTPEEYKAKFIALSRDPFHDPLGKLLSSAPEPVDLQKLAREKPLDWARMVQIMAKLVGYADKTESKSDIWLKFMNMSDSDLEKHIQKAQKEIIDAEYTIVSEKAE